MMKNCVTRITIFGIALFLVLSSLTVFASSKEIFVKNEDVTSSKDRFNALKEQFLLSNDIAQDLEEQVVALENNWILQAELQSSKHLDDTYGGVYINKDNVLVINIVADEQYASEASEIQKAMSGTNVIYKFVEHSALKLEHTIDSLFSLVGHYGIQSAAVNYGQNAVVVSLTHRNDIEKIIETVDCSAIKFVDAPEGYIVVNTAINIQNGNAGGNSAGSSGKAFTIGIKAKSKSTGKIGVLTAGHISTGINSTIYYNGATTAMGTLKQKAFTGSVDGSFIETNSNYTPTKSFMNGDTYGGAFVDVVEGTNVSLYGWISGKSNGVVLDTNYLGNAGGGAVSNMIQCSYVAVLGDSGGAVCAIGRSDPRDPATTTWAVQGLQSHSILVNGTTWGPLSSSIFSPINSIASSLNVNVNP